MMSENDLIDIWKIRHPNDNASHGDKKRQLFKFVDWISGLQAICVKKFSLQT